MLLTSDDKRHMPDCDYFVGESMYVYVEVAWLLTEYNTLALPVLLYGSETWTIKARDTRRITAAEMKYMRRIAGYTWTD